MTEETLSIKMPQNCAITLPLIRCQNSSVISFRVYRNGVLIMLTTSFVTNRCIASRKSIVVEILQLIDNVLFRPLL